jgi:ribosomal-protein-alanine N-acetyltransferase
MYNRFMQQIRVKLIQLADYKGVHMVDVLTQIQYLGKKWKNLSSKKKTECLVSREEDFKAYVDSGCSLVAYVENNVVGFLFAYENSPFKNSIYISHIAIKPEFQSKGIGQLLYRKLISIAKQKRIKKIEALINIDNPNSIRLHKKMGFLLKDRKEAILLSKEK